MTTIAASKPPEGAKPTKRTTRSAIRHSLNFASVGKALADVMNKEKEKDNKDTDRKKNPSHKHSASTTSTKNTTTRRTSTLLTKGAKTLDPLPEGLAKVDTTPDEFVMNTMPQLGLRLWSALYFSVFDMTADSTLEGLKRPVSSRCNSLTFTAGTKD